MSKALINKDSWLLSYSDLFLLVLSFFVMRHPLLTPPHEISTVKEEQIISSTFQIDNQTKLPEDTTNDFTIKKSWFDSNNDLTVVGEESLNLVKMQLKNSAGKLKIEYINNSSDSILEINDEERLLKIINYFSDSNAEDLEFSLKLKTENNKSSGKILVVY
jgi:hypothetical protein